MSLKDRISKNQRTHDKGYISFTEEDLREATNQNQANAEAYSLLDAAMHTSSHITEQDRNGNECLIDNIYPCTKAECEEMDDLLNQAERAVVDKNDNFFRERLDELRDIVKWSRKKHWNFKWSLIFGCIFSIFGMMYLQSDAEEDANARASELSKVESWTEQDTTIAYDACTGQYTSPMPINSANANKSARLATIKYYIESAENNIKEYQARIDTCTNKKFRESYQESIENYQSRIKEKTKQYEEINNMKFSEYKQLAISEMQSSSDEASSHATWMYLLLIYVIILIPAYIYYTHQYGYNITRHRTEAKVLGGIQTVAFSIAGFFLGSGLAMSLLPDYEVTYSDGHKETEGNALNIAILALKLFLMFIGLVIFAVTSVLIMSYVTIIAIKRDHDWSKLSAATIAVAKQANSKIQEKINEKK